MLDSGLSDIISGSLSSQPTKFVDLFSGSGAVARWVAESHTVPVECVDSQLYAKVLGAAIIERHEKAEASVLNDWILSSQELFRKRSSRLPRLPDHALDSDVVYGQRAEAEVADLPGFVARDYGGHYFSIDQGVAFDCLLENLPASKSERLVALAALIESASSCAASPGHTAQPFQPTKNLVKHIDDAWRRDPFMYVSRKTDSFARRYALVPGGRAFQQDALAYIKDGISDESVVFCDPPYSEVQYSRFYHVLEGIARGGWGEVYGAGRAPLGAERFSSSFSSRRGSTAAFSELFCSLAEKSATVILTFPDHECSNGQSSESLVSLAREWFRVSSTEVKVSHSSLGASPASRGKRGDRVPRRDVKESVLVLSPLLK